MQIISIQVGKPQIVHYRGRDVATGILKAPVTGPVMLRKLNLQGDEQADLRVHGGIDKALYAYACDAYDGWKKLRPQDTWPWGALGENLSCQTLPESQIFVGDKFELGQAVVQATQPRFPCFKLGIKFNDVAILKQFNRLNRPGVYFRVLQEGLVDIGDTLRLIDSEAIQVSILEIFNLSHQSDIDEERIREILKIKSLPQSLRLSLREALGDE